MKHTVVHHADVATARRAAEAALASYQERYPGYHPAAVWTTEEHADISFQVKGVHLRGAIDLRPQAIDLDLEVPFLFRVFRDRALRVVESEIRKWLAATT